MNLDRTPILSRLRSWMGGEQRSLTWEQVLGTGNNRPPAAGMDVTHHSTLGLAAFWRGVQCYTGTIGSLPRHVFERVGDEDREKARDHYVYPLVHERVNPHMTDQVFFEVMVHHVLVTGNFYAEIEWTKGLRPKALWPLDPNSVEALVTPAGQLYYRVSQVGRPVVELESWRVVHIPGFGWDGYKGYSVLTMARQSISLSLATERFGASWFGNGTWPGLVMQHPKELSQAARGRIENSLRQLLAGPDKAHGLLIMEEGATVEKIGIPPEDSQFLQTRQHQDVEIARWLNLPPHKVGHNTGARPGGNIEAENLSFYMESIRPLLVKIEKELNYKLFPDNNAGRFYIEHEVDAILRADSKTRYGNYKTAVEGGWMSIETVAAKENLPKPSKPIETTPLQLRVRFPSGWGGAGLAGGERKGQAPNIIVNPTPVRVILNMPKQAPPNVTVMPTPHQVTVENVVNVPRSDPARSIKIQRDANGAIKSATIEDK